MGFFFGYDSMLRSYHLRVTSKASVARCGLNGLALPVADAARPFRVQRSVSNEAAPSARRTPGTANRAAEPASVNLPVRRKMHPASATNIANRKRYRFGKPRNHNGFGVLLCHFSSETQKISFPQNALWGGLELNTLAFLGAEFAIFFAESVFFCFSNC